MVGEDEEGPHAEAKGKNARSVTYGLWWQKTQLLYNLLYNAQGFYHTGSQEGYSDAGTGKSPGPPIPPGAFRDNPAALLCPALHKGSPLQKRIDEMGVEEVIGKGPERK
jgi:hypothetical protein